MTKHLGTNPILLQQILTQKDEKTILSMKVFPATKVSPDATPSHIDNVLVEELVGELTTAELECAARSSYAYAHGTDNSHSTKDIHSRRAIYAKKMAMRYYKSTHQDKARALGRLRDTIKFRLNNDLDSLRDALEDPVSSYHDELKQSLSSGHLFVQGYDRDGRSTFVFLPRNVRRHDQVWTLREHIWTLERAIACSRSPDNTVNAVVDFAGFNPISQAPPTAIGAELVSTLRSHYAGHINQIFIVNASASFMCLWAVFRPLMGKKTRDKIRFLSTEKQKLKLVGKWYDRDEAPDWMLPNGKKNRRLDISEYLETAFNRAFDDH